MRPQICLLLGAGLALSVMTTAAVPSAAWFKASSSPAVNRFAPLELEIEVDENQNLLREATRRGFVSGAQKEVRLANPVSDGHDVPAYLRCALVPVWRTPAGDNAGVLMSGPVQTADTLTWTWADGSLTLDLADDWAEHWTYRDELFYYHGAVDPGQETTLLLKDAHFSGVPSGDLLELTVVSDGVQAVGTGQPVWTQLCTGEEGTA